MKRFIDKETGKEVNVLTEEEAIRIARMYVNHCTGKEKMPNNRLYLVSFLYDFLVYGDDDDMENMIKALAEITNSQPEEEKATYTAMYNIFKKYEEFTKDDIKIVEATSYIFSMDNNKTVINRKKANNEQLDATQKALSGLFDEGLDFSSFASHICEVWNREVKEKLSHDGVEVDIPLDDELAYQDLLQFSNTGKLPEKAEYMIDFKNLSLKKKIDDIEIKQESNINYENIQEKDNSSFEDSTANSEQNGTESESKNYEYQNILQGNNDNEYENFEDTTSLDNTAKSEEQYTAQEEIPTIEIALDDIDDEIENNENPENTEKTELTQENNNYDYKMDNNNEVDTIVQDQVQVEGNNSGKLDQNGVQQNNYETFQNKGGEELQDIVLEDDGPSTNNQDNSYSVNTNQDEKNIDIDFDMNDVNNMYNDVIEESRLSSEDDDENSFRD